MFPNVRQRILKWPQHPPLLFQIKFGEMLLTGGADPNIRTTTTTIPRYEPAINWSIHHGLLEVTKLLLRFGVELCNYENDGRHALHQCAWFTRTDHAEMLLAAGADPNILDGNGNPPLFTALCKGSIELVKLLIKHTDLSITNKQRESAHHAIFQERFHRPDTKAAQYLSLLLEEGLDVEARCECRNTVIAAAAFAHALESIEVCIKAGCKLDVYTSTGQTILTSLLKDWYPRNVQVKPIHLIEMIIKAGADVNFNTRRGDTPLQIAISSYNIAGAWLLLQANCSVKVTRKLVFAREFMGTTILAEAQYCAVFLFGDFCQTTEDQQIFFDLSRTERMLENGEPLDLTRPPLSLARLCRLAVRATLPSGAAFPPAVDKLPLPTYTKDYIALRV